MEVLVTPGGHFAIGWIDGLLVFVGRPEWSYAEWVEVGEISVQAQSAVHVHPVALVYAPGRAPTVAEQSLFAQRSGEMRMQRMRRIAFVTDGAEARSVQERMMSMMPVRVSWRAFAQDDLLGALAWLREVSRFELQAGLALHRHLLDLSAS